VEARLEVAGTVSGGQKAAATNKRLHGEDFYKVQGRLGGLAGKGPNYTGGFAGDRDLASRAGTKGGRISRRGKSRVKKAA
jgi:general stress protein YciG